MPFWSGCTSISSGWKGPLTGSAVIPVRASNATPAAISPALCAIMLFLVWLAGDPASESSASAASGCRLRGAVPVLLLTETSSRHPLQALGSPLLASWLKSRNDATAVQPRNIDFGLPAICRELNSGLDVTASFASQVMPRPMPLYELGWWAVVKWLAVEKRLRLLIRQLLCKDSSLIRGQRGWTRCAAATSKQRKCERD